jgi:hypothetical protein
MHVRQVPEIPEIQERKPEIQERKAVRQPLRVQVIPAAGNKACEAAAARLLREVKAVHRHEQAAAVIAAAVQDKAAVPDADKEFNIFYRSLSKIFHIFVN